ncbi:acyltransferase family protein [Roseibium sp. CAU 1637]|uniref:Acyltransferase family protein n=1 Tax=Roseibium limicola TaxID=2816037 RepID=A0A939ESR0_9HYPH|nr:acyltransferase family protein [Roseibium limicola]MBO0347221.1 acyltransferase family protein [Roseibium limicola]
MQTAQQKKQPPIGAETSSGTTAGASRVSWVDIAKGISICLVVMMHSVLGVEKAVGAEGWMHGIVAFCQPFRIPAFFLISGLFLARALKRDWADFLDRKLLHFAYFYVLWLTLQFIVKAPIFAADVGWGGVVMLYLTAFIEPFGTLWFIYLLPLFAIVVKLARGWNIPTIPVLAIAALLHLAPIHTGSVLIDEFASRFVFFVAGYAFAERVFAVAEWARSNGAVVLAALVGWGLINGGLVVYGLEGTPGIALVLGGLGALAVASVASLATTLPIGGFLRFFGKNSLVIYLAFFFPMGVARTILLKLGLFDIGTTSLLVTLTAILSPLVLKALIDWSGWGTFLFERPNWARLAPKAKPQPV